MEVTSLSQCDLQVHTKVTVIPCESFYEINSFQTFFAHGHTSGVLSFVISLYFPAIQQKCAFIQAKK